MKSRNIQYKRGNLLIILLGYIFAVIAGVNGVEGIHDMLYVILGFISSGWITRVIHAVQILLIYLFCSWSFTYIGKNELTEDEEGKGFYEHKKYDSFTRVNGVCMLVVFLVVAVLHGIELTWW